MPEGKTFSLGLIASLAALAMTSLPAAAQQQKRPNVVMLMTDDTGWNDSVPIQAAAPLLAMRHRTSIGSPRKVRPSRAGMVKRAAPQAVPHS